MAPSGFSAATRRVSTSTVTRSICSHPRARPSRPFATASTRAWASTCTTRAGARQSLLSVAYDKARSENAGRRLTKKLCAVIRDALEPFASGQIGRYDDEFEVRAFGDNITLWGTPVVLIETGGFPSAEPDPPLVRMNFVAILYILVKNATVVSGTGVRPFLADIGIQANRRVRTLDGKRQIALQASISDLGDLRTLGALRTIDAQGRIATPLWDASLKEGQEVELPDWSKVPQARTIATGQSAEIVLLRPVTDSARPSARYVVDTILKY